MPMSTSLLTLDVREVLNAGGEPFEEIMRAVASLAPGQGLRLLATFKPVPLFGVMSQQGYSHTEHEIGGGDWEVVFMQTGESVAAEPPLSRSPSVDAPCLDVRGLLPPEPMQKALEAVEALGVGESLQLLTDREPTLLYQELGRRHHAFVGEQCAEGYRTTIRHGGAVGERA